MISQEEFFNKLHQGCQIRVTYNTQFHDNCEEDGWWSEELWCYDKNTDTYRCYYPVYSYEKDFYTTHNKKDAEFFYREMKQFYDHPDDTKITNLSVENLEITLGNKTIREAVMDKIAGMDEEELREILLM